MLVDLHAVGHVGGERYVECANRRLDSHALLATHAKHAADSQNLLLHCGKVLGARTLWELCEQLEFSGPTELLSMWLCLFSGSQLCSEKAWCLLDTPRALVVACLACQCLVFTVCCMVSASLPHVLQFKLIDLLPVRRGFVHVKRVAPHPANLLQVLARLLPMWLASPSP